jgi:flagellar biosynthesis protein FlhA
LAEVVRVHAARLLSRQDVKLLVDAVKASDPVVADELASAGLALADVQRVLQLLLDEQVAVRDLVRILEVLSERARLTKDHETLTEATRTALGPAIAAAHAVDGRLPVITFDPLTEHTLVASLRAGDGGVFLAADAALLERIVLELSATVRTVENQGDRPVILCSNALRPALRKLLRPTHPDLPVLAFGELGPELRIDNVGMVNGADSTTV